MNKEKLILSLYFGFHDSNIAIASEKEILLHLEAERVYRKKHMRFNTTDEMINFIRLGLDYLNIQILDITDLYIAKWNNKFELDKNGMVEILGKKFKPVITSHHNNHIGTISPFNLSDALVVCADGGSEDGVSKIYLKTKSKIELIEDLSNTVMTGRFYGTLTQIIINPDSGGAHNFDAGKTMGLAAYGGHCLKLQELVEKYGNEMNNLYFEGCSDLRKKFGISDNYDRPWEDKRRKDLAYTGQEYWISKFVSKISEYANLSKNICLVGGCGLNVVLNSRLLDLGLFENVHVSPVSNDSGQSLGAILYQNPTIKCDYPFLGRGFGEIRSFSFKVIDDLLNHKIIAWYQGRSESGSRALGHRSFLGLPDGMKMKKRLNDEIKKREPYRPLAPIIIEPLTSEYFDSSHFSPFMTFAFKAKEITKKMAPAIVHNDGTSRIQTLNEEKNFTLYQIINIIREKTNIPILMNTSFNIQGEPIVDTPGDAFNSFLNSGADVLYINGERHEK